MTKLTHSFCEDTGKELGSLQVLKSEFLAWATHGLFEIQDINIDNIYEGMFLTVRRGRYKNVAAADGDGNTVGAESSVTFDTDNTDLKSVEDNKE